MNMQIIKSHPPSLHDPIYAIKFFERDNYTQEKAEIVLSEREYTQEVLKGSFSKGPRYPYNPFLVTIPKGNCGEYVKNLTLPSTFNLSLKVNKIVLRIFAVIATLIADIISLPIRLITAPFFYRVQLPPKESHPLHKLLQEKCVFKEVLERNVHHIEVFKIQKEKTVDPSKVSFMKRASGVESLNPSHQVTYSRRYKSINTGPLLFGLWQSHFKQADGFSLHIKTHKHYFLKLHKHITEAQYDLILAENTKQSKHRPAEEVLSALQPYLKEPSYKQLYEKLSTEGCTRAFLKTLKKTFLLQCHLDKNPKMELETYHRLLNLVEKLSI